MTKPLVAGQTLASDYTLLHPLESSETNTAPQSWLAIQESTQERVQLTPIDQHNGVEVSAAQRNLDRFKPLLHPNILKNYQLIEENGDHFMVSEYRRGLKPIDISRPLHDLWPQLKSIIAALEYAHSLGFVHGAISPTQIRMADDGNAYLSGFGYANSHQNEYLAPEVLKAGESNATPAADIYSIGQFLQTILNTGEASPALEQSTELSPVLASMLSPHPGNRPTDFSGLINAVEHQADQTILEPMAFTKVPTEPVKNEPAISTESFEHRLPRERQVVSTHLVLIALGAIIVLALGLFFIISNPAQDEPVATVVGTVPAMRPPQDEVAKGESDNPTASNALNAAPIELAPLELAKIEELKQRGTVLASELLRRQVEVEDVGGRLWAGDRYDVSINLGIEGDEAYREAQFQLAVDKYTAGVELLGEILDETDDIFDTELIKAEQALLQGDADQALSSYQILTRIEPQDTELARGLKRARSLQEVVNLTRDAEIMERNGDLEGALETFRAANDLDEEWLSADKGMRRIKNLLARRNFQKEMSKGFQALANAEFENARAAFETAQRILPNSKEPLDGLQQIGLAKRQSEIQTLKQQADQLESENNWAAAIPVYEKILTVTPGLTSASAALQQAKKNTELEKTLKLYIEQPQLMQSDEDLQRARSALVEAATSAADFKELTRQLSHLVSLARIEINVVLNSDGKTDVTVYQVGRYGTLDSTNLSLIPGVYTFVGKRSGYRDVYQEIHVKGDINPVIVDVRCSEKI